MDVAEPHAFTPDMRPDLGKIDLGSIVWLRSIYSTGVGGQCEVGLLDHGGALLRDSQSPDGPVLAFSANEWDAFLRGALAGDFGEPRPVL